MGIVGTIGIPIKPLDAFELPFVDRVKANWTSSPLVFGGPQIMQDTGKAENLSEEGLNPNKETEGVDNIHDRTWSSAGQWGETSIWDSSSGYHVGQAVAALWLLQ